MADFASNFESFTQSMASIRGSVQKLRNTAPTSSSTITPENVYSANGDNKNMTMMIIGGVIILALIVKFALKK